MLIQHALLVAVIGLLSSDVRGESKPRQLTRFQPISQAEYEAILALTDGKPVVSEGRLIEGGLAALAGLASDWVTSLRFPNIFSSRGLAQKSTDASYPLCVIKTEENPNKNHYHEYHHYDDTFRDNQEAQEASHEEYLDEYMNSHGHGVSVEVEWHKNQQTPVVNCIVVQREKGQLQHEANYQHYQTTTKRPKRPRKKNRVHSPSDASQNSVAPTSYNPHTSPSSYNSPWYWSSPYYNPFYSDTQAYTANYPAAYQNIYAGLDPSAFSGNYPIIYPGTFAPPPASNNPNPYYNPYPGSYSPTTSSALRGDTFNSQSSSIASSYPNMEIPLINQISPQLSTMDSNFIYQMQPSEEGVTAAPQKESPAIHPLEMEEEKPDIYLAPVKSKKKATTRVPMTSVKTKRTNHNHNKMSRPQKGMKANQSSPTKVIPTRRHTKSKRDEAGTQSNSYTKIASNSDNGYEPTLYPQNSYQSNYPKVSYSHALPYPAPVYVRNSIEQPSAAVKMKQYYANEPDSEENDDPAEFIEVRSNH